MAKRGDAVRYRAIAGEVYDAVLAGDVRPDGFVAVDVSVPGQREPVTFSRVIWRESEPGDWSVCTAWPGEAASGEAEAER
jgi:hypothetical protein